MSEIRHRTRNEHHNKQRPRDHDDHGPVCDFLPQFRRQRHHATGPGRQQPQFPVPRHQVQMALPSHHVPKRSQDLDRKQKHHNQQRAEQGSAHYRNCSGNR